MSLEVMNHKSVTHTFNRSLSFSHKASDLPLWEHTYRQSFPGFMACHDHRKDGQHQRHGIDRSVILENGKQIFIDEKARGRNRITKRVYEDIALEFLSHVGRNEPGWVCKPLLCDYINYGILPLGIAYLLPTLALQQAWVKHGKAWLALANSSNRDYRIIDAQNKGYMTRSCCVPASVVLGAIQQTLVATFAKVEWDQ